MDFGSRSAAETPTIIVQDAFTSGGAQQAGRVHGRNLTLASDMDYVRGIHSWRGGVQMYADWYHANLNNNYLGTYIFSSLAAYEAGTPLLYTRSTGDPAIDFFHSRIGTYFQDDIRIKKGLTLSPGVRYSYQTRVGDVAAFEPRVGITWAPMKNGNTTLRASGGIFHGWLDPGIWWQTVRFDSTHQRDPAIQAQYLRERQQPDESRELQRLQRRHDVAVLHEPDQCPESAESRYGYEYQFLTRRPSDPDKQVGRAGRQADPACPLSPRV